MSDHVRARPRALNNYYYFDIQNTSFDSLKLNSQTTKSLNNKKKNTKKNTDNIRQYDKHNIMLLFL